ncbi:hypothetical protein EDD17DRAFT_1566012 [Pisolithus thermaeus]|nr:hypothetical protein EV401DRAFT_2053480 [Pisolithus croceorrhizus]KAI6136146.1 hypothetical protein F5141DRAFT_1072799 [Pisolithus sp. B1]KAI6163664.1 hypothetical protein EDD17DRAFT_1566012 [Pisolithus thermaeus]
MFGRSSFAVSCIFSLLLCSGVAANTEIINFISDLQHSVDLSQAVVGNWATLNASHNERRWAVQPAPFGTPLHDVCEADMKSTLASPMKCPHELWITLNLDDTNWKGYRAFTLRLSWAASTPADFLIELYSPETVSTFLAGRQQRQITLPEGAPSFREGPPPITRTKYARIRVVDAGVPTPQIQLDRPNLHLSDRVVEPVHFILILEQLYGGVLPASQLPTICFLISVLLAAAMAVPRLLAYLDPFVLQAREDLSNIASSKKAQ